MKLGQKLIINSYYKRIGKWTRSGDIFKEYHKTWEIKKFSKYKNVIVIGIRNLSNGVVNYEDEVPCYEAKNYFKALLVVENMSKNPFYVPIIN